MPSSLVKNALGTWYQTKISSQETSGPVQPGPPLSDTDREIAEIAKQLDVCIKIIGCGGGGLNTINRCVDAGIDGAQLCAINTDAKHLLTIRSHLGSLSEEEPLVGWGPARFLRTERPRQGRTHRRSEFLKDSNIVFVTAGMGGGTGTGSAHYVAGIAKEQIRALTLGVVTCWPRER